MSDNGTNNAIIEALVLASPEPLPAKKIVEYSEGFTPAGISKAVAELNNRYMEMGNAYRIREVAGGYQFYILPEYSGYVEELFTRRRKMRLTRAALETLAIAAYRQPVTKTEIEQIRGVASDGVIHNLLEKNMLAITGRASTIGKPLQYGTTDDFLKFFGLNRLEDLPKMSEIEELVAASEPENQTELNLETSPQDGYPVKLNIADGTYKPDSEQDDDILPDQPAGGASLDDEVDESEELQTVNTGLEENDTDQVDFDDANGDNGETFHKEGNGDGESSGIVVDLDISGNSK